MKRETIVVVRILMFLFCIGITGLPAQTKLNVKLNDGTQTNYLLSDIQKLTFSMDSLVVTKSNATPQVLALSTVRFISFTEYTIKAIPVVKKDVSRLKLFLSPANEELHISYLAVKHETVQIRIMNMQGKIILTQTYENTKGENNVKLDISKLPVGLYIVSNGAETRPVLKHIR